MTSSTFDVAVCCSSDSRNSFNSRAFSIAITAWSAKVARSSICRSVNGLTVWRASPNTPIGSPPRSIGAHNTVR